MLELTNTVPQAFPSLTEAFKMQSGFLAPSCDEYDIQFDLSVKGKHVYICKYDNLNFSLAALMWTPELHCSTQKLTYTSHFSFHHCDSSHLRADCFSSYREVFCDFSIDSSLAMNQGNSEPKCWDFVFLKVIRNTEINLELSSREKQRRETSYF